MFKKKNKYNDLNDKILNEIRDKVFEESENVIEEKEKQEEEQINLEVLQEMTDLPMSRIKKIANEVKSKYKKDKKKSSGKSYNLRKIIRLSIYFVFLALLIGFPTYSIVKNNQKVKKQQAYRNLLQEYSKLVGAASKGNKDMVVHFLNNGVPAEIEGYEYTTALMASIKAGHMEIIDVLLKNGADITKKNKDGKTTMDIANETVSLSVKRKIEQEYVKAIGGDNSINELWKMNLSYSKTAFEKCVRDKNFAALELYLAADEDKLSNNWDDWGMIEAAKSGSIQVLEFFLNNEKNIHPNTKANALVLAAGFGQNESIEILLEDGVDINSSYNNAEGGFTALTKSLARRSKSYYLLLKMGADPNLAGGYDSYTPIQHILHHLKNRNVTNEMIEQIRLLIFYGADVNKKDNNGISFLGLARSLRYSELKEIIKILKLAGAEITFSENSFRSLIYENDAANVRKLLEKGIDPNIQGLYYDDKERSALIKSVTLDHYEVAKTLIEFGANVNFITQKSNLSALLVAVNHKNEEMIELLISNGAKVTTRVQSEVDECYGYDCERIKALIKKAKQNN